MIQVELVITPNQLLPIFIERKAIVFMFFVIIFTTTKDYFNHII